MQTWTHWCDASSVKVPPTGPYDKLLSARGSAKRLEDDPLHLTLQICERKLSHLEAYEKSAPPLECQQLSRELTALAAEALERACSRKVPGAMDVFEEATAAIERLAGLLGTDTSPPHPKSPASHRLDSPQATCLVGLDSPQATCLVGCLVGVEAIVARLEK